MATKATTVPVLLHKDAWDETGTRRQAGTVVDLPVAAARTLIDAGKAQRADPMPGDD